MRVLLHSSNPPSEASGYGTQGRVIVRALLARGHSVVVLAHSTAQHPAQGNGALTLDEFSKVNPRVKLWVEEQRDANAWMQGVRWIGGNTVNIRGRMSKAHLNQVILANAVDLYISFYDTFINTGGSCVVPALCLQPTHFYPLPHADHMAFSDFDVLIGISRYGYELFKRHFGFAEGERAARQIEWIPHSRPVRSTFVPLPELLDASPGSEKRLLRARKAIREAFGMPPDAFVVVCAGSGSERSDRKKFCAQVQAICRFMQRADLEADTEGVPRKKMFAYFHTETVRTDNNQLPWNDLGKFLETFGELPERTFDYRSFGARTAFDPQKPLVGPRVRIVAQASDAPNGFMGCSEERIRDMYRAADVVCHATASEGCGVGLLEAQSVGTPVVTTACTAMFELTELGISVPPSHYCPRQDFNSGWAEPDVRGITDALMTIFHWSKDERVSKTKKALKITQREWDDALQAERWMSLVDTMEADVVKPLSLGDKALRAAWSPVHVQIPQARWLQLSALAELRPLTAALVQETAKRSAANVMLQAARARMLYVRGALKALRALQELHE